MAPRARAIATWFIAGMLIAGILQFAQAQALGGHPSALLSIGSQDPVSEVVIGQLEGATALDGLGHDGQVYYAIGLDLLGEEVPEIMSEAGYRYRRILYPALASILGTQNGEPLLWMMITLNAAAVGAAAAAVHWLGARRNWPAWIPLVVLAHPGVWLAVRLLTPDAVAFAAALGGVVAYREKRPLLSAMLMAAAILAKEPYAVFPATLICYSFFAERDTKSARVLAVSFLPPAAWWVYVHTTIGDGLYGGGNVDLPAVGIAEALPVWGTGSASDLALGLVTLFALLTAVAVVKRTHNLWTWLTVPWIVIGVLSSHFIWDFGNNAIRALLPLLALQVMAVVDAKAPLDPRVLVREQAT